MYKLTLAMLGLLIPTGMVAGQMHHATPDTVEYDLTVDYQTVNFTGKDVQAITINGGIPGPTLTFTEGDFAVVRVHNPMDVQTSIHWHGLLLPNQEDGVPYLTTYPVAPGGTHTFNIPLIQSGTYWYHSHTGLQEQRGVYGSIVIHPREYNMQQHADLDQVLVLSDWTDENPNEVLRTLKRGSEWYEIKKGSSQSWDRVIANKAVGNRLRQSFQRMPPMDISDVYYDRFLINGEVEHAVSAEPGDVVRLRIINAGGSTYFNVQYAGGSMQLIETDGLPVTPVEVDRIPVAVAETYDVLVKVPESGSVEFRATAQDGSGHASAFLGEGERVMAPDIPPPNLFMMDHSMMDMGDMEMGDMDEEDGEMMNHDEMEHHAEMVMEEEEPMPMDEHAHHAEMAAPEQEAMDEHAHHAGMTEPEPAPMDEHAYHAGMAMPESAPSNECKVPEPAINHMNHASMDHSTMDHSAMTDERIFDYSMLCAAESTKLPPENPVREVRLELTGSMERYVWTFNNKTLSESDKIMIKRGENVRFVLVNTTMMHHPMHLHGHFFRVLNGQGDYAPLKHTVDVAPMTTTVIEFEANEEKDWFFHCHVLYHMKAGMSRVISYEGSEIDPEMDRMFWKMSKKTDGHWYTWGEVAALSQANMGSFEVSNTRNGLGVMWEADWTGLYEIEGGYTRYVSRFFNFFLGGDLDEHENLAVAGIRYVLPFNLDSELRIDHNGGVRFQVGGGIDLLPRLHAGWEVNTDEEWEVEMEIVLSKMLSLAGTYDSHYGAGGGLAVRL